ncbi:VWA domain-containing protein [Leclercia pneumoniae]|uniref:VWA domain-containing protein n=1 Tax=Leclercia pneumoniae TaxID=2815358 RepID=UPI003BF4BA1F
MFDSLLSILQRFGFDWPWLWLLLPLPLLLAFMPPTALEHQQSVRVPNLPSLLDDAPHAGRSTTGGLRGKTLLAGVIWCCLVCTASRPHWLAPPEFKEVSARDIILVLDVSGSMATEDMQDSEGKSITRAAAMQQAVNHFIHQRKEDNIGLIVFGSKAYPFAPVSADHAVLLQRVQDIRPAMAGPQTSIGDAIGSTIKMIQNREKEQGSDAPQERMVVLLTDGKDTASTLPPEVALRLAKREKMTIHTIALAGGNQESINLPLLRKIAQETGGTFHAVAGSADSLASVYNALNQLTPKKMMTQSWSWRKPLWLWPLATALLALVALAASLLRGGERYE